MCKKNEDRRWEASHLVDKAVERQLIGGDAAATAGA
jgi:hypothetical protein